MWRTPCGCAPYGELLLVAWKRIVSGTLAQVLPVPCVAALQVFRQLSDGQCRLPARQRRGNIGLSQAGVCDSQLLIALTFPALL